MDSLPAITLVEDAERARMVLDPVKRRLLTALREPDSAAGLARRLELPRQQIGYHLRALEQAGLVRLVEARQRRGFVERLLVAVAQDYVLDPAMLAGKEAVDQQDRHAAGYLVGAAGNVVREVTRMRGAAEASGQRLLTFTIEAEIGFADPAEFEAFSQSLAKAVAELAQLYPAAPDRRGYHVMIGAHPAVAGQPDKQVN